MSVTRRPSMAEALAAFAQQPTELYTQLLRISPPTNLNPLAPFNRSRHRLPIIARNA
jgi:hypothetical protein